MSNFIFPSKVGQFVKYRGENYFREVIELPIIGKTKYAMLAGHGRACIDLKRSKYLFLPTFNQEKCILFGKQAIEILDEKTKFRNYHIQLKMNQNS